MKNTIENKEKFFAQYWGQKILNSLEDDQGNRWMKNFSNKSVDFTMEDDYLELKDLRDITDEDFMEFKENILNKEALNAFSKSKLSIVELIHIRFVSDFFRSKGYLVPYMGLSCKDLVNYGWVKII